VLEQLRGAYARYDASDIARALWATAELFEHVERESAELLGLPLSLPHSQVRQRLGEILAASP
jgi:hypothetical protein